MPIDVGWNDPLVAKSLDALTKHAANLGTELELTRHTLTLSIRLEAAKPTREHHTAGCDAHGEHVDVADWKWVGQRRGRASDLTKSRREQTDERVPRDAGQVAADEHEAGGAIDYAEQAAEHEPGWHQDNARLALTRRQWWAYCETDSQPRSVCPGKCTYIDYKSIHFVFGAARGGTIDS